MGTEYGGIHITGGELSGAVAFGTHARATVNNVEATTDRHEEVADLLNRLERLIGEHRESLEDPAKISRDVADIKAEISEPEPDKPRMLDALKRISIRAAEVTAIVEVVGKLRDLFS